MANEKRMIEYARFRGVLDRYAHAPHTNLRNDFSRGMRLAAQSCLELLDAQPIVDAVEVVHGRWEKHGKHDWRCSVCKVGVPYSYTGHNYCPNCGADMR